MADNKKQMKNEKVINKEARGGLRPKYVWDYDLPKDWAPQTEDQWLWMLERKINYGDWQGLTAEMVKRYFPKLKKYLDPGKRMMFEYYFKIHG